MVIFNILPSSDGVLTGCADNYTNGIYSIKLHDIEIVTIDYFDLLLLNYY